MSSEKYLNEWRKNERSIVEIIGGWPKKMRELIEDEIIIK